MDALANIKIGTCAWTYDDWRGVFYPENLPKAQWLSYSQTFDTVEINNTFYTSLAPRLSTLGESKHLAVFVMR